MKPRTVCKRKFLIPLLAAAMLVGAGTVLGQEEAPSGEAIMDRYVEATGGLETYDAIENRHSIATLDLAAMGVKLNIEMWEKKPNLMASVATSEAIGEVSRGTDGKMFWEISTMTGPRLLEGEELAEALRESKFDGMAYWRDIYDSVQYAGMDTVNSKPAYKVIVTPKAGNPQTLFFDKETGYLVKSVSILQHQMGEIPVTSFVKDYREVGDLTMAFESEIHVMDQVRTFTINSVEHNVDMPDSLFTPPDDVKALIEE